MSLDEIKHDCSFLALFMRLSALRIQSFRLKKQIKQQSCNCFNYDDNDIDNKVWNIDLFNWNYYFYEFDIYYNDY